MHALFFDDCNTVTTPDTQVLNPTSRSNVYQNYDDPTVYVINARSLVNKMDLLRAYISEFKPKIICITESWGHADLNDAFFSVNGYSYYRCDRGYGHGGGVLLYVCKTLCSTFVSKFDDGKASAVTCTITSVTEEKLSLTCVYIPPDYCLLSGSVMIYLNDVANYSSHFKIICGDFNCPDINWNSMSATTASQLLLNWCLDNFFNQNVTKPTRPQSKTVLDLVFSSVGTCIDNITINECFGKSDHAIVSFSLPSIMPHVKKRISRDVYMLDKANWKLFQKHLFESYWPHTMPGSDLNQVWNQYIGNIVSAAQCSIPVRQKRPWSPTCAKKVRTALRNHRRLFRQCALSPTTCSSNQWKLDYSQNILKKEIKMAVYKHEISLCSRVKDKTNSKPFWSYVKNKMKTRNQLSSIVDDDGLPLKDDKDIANRFNVHFSSNFNTLSYPPPEPHLRDASNELDFVQFTPLNTLKVINELPSTSSMDGSGLCYRIIKKGGLFLATKLSNFFSLSLSTHSIPDEWRRIIVTPIYKSGPVNQCKNFRPIGITSCVCRIMERIMRRVMMNHLLSHHALSLPSSQHGFCPGRSVDTASVTFVDFLTDNVDRGKIIHAIYLDYAKAFDSVPHTLLLAKLRNFGISGFLFKWIANYLQNRHQVVRINNVLSDPMPVRSGVIQGSVLGPLLFIVFISDIDLTIKNSQIIKYADDIKLYLSAEKLPSSQIPALQCDLNMVYQWSKTNGLSLNVNKCKFICFGKIDSKHSYLLNEVPLEQVSSIKDLGVTFSSSISFKEHVNNTVIKANRMLGLLKRCFCTRDPDCMLSIYKANVRSILEYGNLIWSPYIKYLIDDVEKVQKRFCKFFPYLNHLDYRSKLHNLNLLSLEARRLRYRLIFLFKILNGFCDLHPDNFFNRTGRSRHHETFDNLLIPYTKLVLRHNFFTVDVVHHWNDMLISERNVNSVELFKKSVLSYFTRAGIW